MAHYTQPPTFTASPPVAYSTPVVLTPGNAAAGASGAGGAGATALYSATAPVIGAAPAPAAQFQFHQNPVAAAVNCVPSSPTSAYIATAANPNGAQVT